MPLSILYWAQQQSVPRAPQQRIIPFKMSAVPSLRSPIERMSWMKQKINNRNLWSAYGVIMFSIFFNIMLRKHELIYGGEREWWILFWKMCLFFSVCFKFFSAAVSLLTHKTKISQLLQPNIATLGINRNHYSSSFLYILLKIFIYLHGCIGS